MWKLGVQVRGVHYGSLSDSKCQGIEGGGSVGGGRLECKSSASMQCWAPGYLP